MVFRAVAECCDVGYFDLEKCLGVGWVPHKDTFFIVAGETTSVWVED